MMAVAYLTANRPARDQWYERRTRALTGCTVLHSAESMFDEIGEDTGAEGVANFIRTRTTAGSYHDLVDTDSEIYLVDYDHGAYHDGTGSNNWALSLSFACRTIDWRRMSPADRKAMLRNGARAFVRQQAYRKARGYPLTELRLITKAQSDAGMSGFTYHGYRDPTRRTDPGTVPPDLFPFAEFIEECRIALGTKPPAPKTKKEPEMMLIRNTPGVVVLLSDSWAEWVPDSASWKSLQSAVPQAQLRDDFFTRVVNSARAAGKPVTGPKGLMAEHEDPNEWPPPAEDDE